MSKEEIKEYEAKKHQISIKILGALSAFNAGLLFNIGPHSNTSFFIVSLVWVGFGCIIWAMSEEVKFILLTKKFLPKKLDRQISKIMMQDTIEDFRKTSILQAQQQYKKLVKKNFKVKRKGMVIATIGSLIMALSWLYEGIITHYSKRTPISEELGQILINSSFGLIVLTTVILTSIVYITMGRKEEKIKKELLQCLKGLSTIA